MESSSDDIVDTFKRNRFAIYSDFLLETCLRFVRSGNIVFEVYRFVQLFQRIKSLLDHGLLLHKQILCFSFIHFY